MVRVLASTLFKLIIFLKFFNFLRFSEGLPLGYTIGLLKYFNFNASSIGSLLGRTLFVHQAGHGLLETTCVIKITRRVLGIS